MVVVVAVVDWPVLEVATVVVASVSDHGGKQPTLVMVLVAVVASVTDHGEKQ